MKNSGKSKAHLAITDPPYNVAIKNSEGLEIMNDDMKSENFEIFLTSAFENMAEQMNAGASFYVWYSSREHINFEISLRKNDLEIKQQLIWNKNTMVLGRSDYQWKHEPCFYGWKTGASHNWYSDRKQTTVIDFDKPAKSAMHPTMKPLGLISYLINNSSKKNDIVIDIFGGSGSTLLACEELNRKCYTMELDEKYASVILQRYEDYTGKKGVLYA